MLFSAYTSYGSLRKDMRQHLPHFPSQFQIFYDAVAGHFIAGAPNLDDHASESNIFSINYFDWTGAYFPSTQPIPLEEIKEADELWYERLVRDCIY